jgi:hypothetical protein
VLDLRAYGGKRQFFQHQVDAEAERKRQLTTLERHGREAIGLPQRELSDFITARNKFAEYGETINNAVKFRVDYLAGIRRHGITAKQLSDEVLAMKRKDGLSEEYINDLALRLRRFCQDFGERVIASITVEELDTWLRNLNGSPGAGRTTGAMWAYCLATR